MTRFSRGMVAAAAVTLMLTACSGGGDSSDGSTASGGAGGSGIVTANGSEPQNPLVPTNTNETGGGRIVDALFEGLVTYGADGAPSNAAADSIETTDQTTFTIKVKPDLVFSDGSALTAKSFVDAWNYGALATNAQLNSSFFEPIAGYDQVSADPPTAQTLSGLTVVDDTTFTVTLSEPTADFPLRLGYSAFFPLPESAYADMAAFGENPVGNGPYKLAQEGAWQHNVRIDLVPNDQYKGAEAPKNGGVSFVFYESLDSAYNDLVSGNLDVLDTIPDSAFGNYESDLGDRAVNQPAAIFQAFTIPQTLEHFSGDEGKLRRQAISYAIDRDQITETIFSGTRTPAKDFTSPVIDGYSADVAGNEVLTYDADKAKELWAQADAISPWSGTFTLAYNADGGHQGWVDATMNGLKNTLGIDAQGKPYPTFAELRTDITNGTIQGAFRSGWQADYPGLYNFLAPNYATGGSANNGGYSNPAFDQLLQQSTSASDVAASNQLLEQSQGILFQDLPGIPLWYANAVGGYGQDVSDVQFGWNSVPLYAGIAKS